MADSDNEQIEIPMGWEWIIVKANNNGAGGFYCPTSVIRWPPLQKDKVFPIFLSTKQC